MGTIFEELIRRFNEENNEEAGEHWTPRDAVRLMANLIFLPIADQIESGTYLLYDGACGTGGMLTVAEETLQQLAARARQGGLHPPLRPGDQRRDLRHLQGRPAAQGRRRRGRQHRRRPGYSTLSNDAFPSREFDFMLSNPPYGKSWKSDLERMGGKNGIKDPRFVIEHAGDPEYSLSPAPATARCCSWPTCCRKMKHDTPLGSRIAEVHNGSSLFTGDAGQGESNIRRWIIENDWLEAIVALPLNMFYNTGIATYIWVLPTASRSTARARSSSSTPPQWFKPLRKNLGKKNCELSDEDIERICDTFLAFEETEQSKIFPNAAFGYWKVTVERPLRLAGIDPDRAYAAEGDQGAQGERPSATRTAPPVIRKIHKTGTRSRSAARPLRGDDRRQARVVEYEPDSDLRDTEQVPLLEEGGIEAFIRREVLPYAPTPGSTSRTAQDRLRDQLHPLLLQAAAAAHPGGDPRRHPGAGAGDRGAAGRDHRERADARDRRLKPLSGDTRTRESRGSGRVPAALGCAANKSLFREVDRRDQRPERGLLHRC